MSNQVDIQSLLTTFHQELNQAKSPQEIEQLRKRYLGKKSQIKLAFKEFQTLSSDEKQIYATQLNQTSQSIESALQNTYDRLMTQELTEKLKTEWIDLSMPGTIPSRGMKHPITQVEEQCIQTLRRLGFVVIDGTEVEKDFYNFEALNIPEHHPARDMQDTFWLEKGLLLRSHTTAVQARILESQAELPIKVISCGRVYRNEAVDATHVAMFHQFEGFWVDKNITFADLKGVLSFVARELYGENRRLRFKPKYYPYTEPSIGMDVECSGCQGKGCVACHGAGWVTIIGAGMIHRNIFERFHYAPDVSGIAFGWGTTRMAAQLFNVKKIKGFYEQDLRLFEALHRNSSL